MDLRTWRLGRLLAIATAVSAALVTGGIAHAAEDRTAMTPPAPIPGYDLVISSLRDHGNCGDTAGEGRRDADQTIRQELADDMESSTLARVTVRNWDYNSRRIQLRGTGTSPYLRVVYFHGSENITKAVVAGTFRTPLLKRGYTYSIGMRVSMRHYVTNGNSKTFEVRALGVRFTNSVIRGDHVQTEVVSAPFDAFTPCPS